MPKLEISKVHDAYREGGECPLCSLAEAAERACLASFQSGRVMEPSARVRTNETGFCPDHLRALYAGENRLGLALMLHTHLQEKRAVLRGALEGILEASGAGRKNGTRLDALVASLAAGRDACVVCESLAKDLDRYAFTIVYLWQKDPEFPPVLRASRGFCVSHFLEVLAEAREVLGADALGDWLREVVPLMTASIDRLEAEVGGFIQLFRASNRSLGTDEERTALARTVQKLAGRLVIPSPPAPS